MGELSFDVDRLKKDKNEKKNKLTGKGAALFSFATDDHDYMTDLADDDEERQANAQAYMDRILSLQEGTEENGYKDIGQMVVEDNTTEQIKRDQYKKTGFFYNKFVKQIPDYEFMGTHFEEVGKKDNYREVMNHEAITLMPGVGLDTANMIMAGVMNKKTNDINITLVDGGSTPVLDIYTGYTNQLVDFSVDYLSFGQANGNKYLVMKTKDQEKNIEEQISPTLKRKTKLKNGFLTLKNVNDSRREKIQFMDATVSYQDTGLEANEGINTLKDVKLSKADFEPGIGFHLENEKGESMYQFEHPKKDVEKKEDEEEQNQEEGNQSEEQNQEEGNQAEVQVKPAEQKNETEVQKAVRKKQSISIQEYLKKPEKAKKKEDEDVTFGLVDALTDYATYEQQKGAYRETEDHGGFNAGLVKDDKDRIKENFGFSAKGDLIKYLFGQKEVMKDGQKVKIGNAENYGGFTNFLLGHQSIFDEQEEGALIESLEKKMETGEPLTTKELTMAKAIINNPDGAAYLAKNIGDALLGTRITSVITELFNQDLLHTDTKHILLNQFIDKKYQTLFNEITSNSGETPVLDFLKRYFTAVKNGEEEPQDMDRTDFPMAKNPFRRDFLAKKAKAAKGLYIRYPLAPFLYGGFTFTPKWGLDMGGNMEFYPDKDGKSLGEAKEEFYQAVSGTKEDASKSDDEIIEEKLKNPRKKKEAIDMEKLFAQSFDNVAYHLKPSFYAGVNAGFSVNGYLSASAGFLLSLKAALEAAIKGSIKANTSLDVLLKVKSTGFDWNMNKTLTANLGAKLNLSGDLNFTSAITSDVFAWKYELFKITFLKAAIKDLGLDTSFTIGDGAKGLADFSAGFAGTLSAGSAMKAIEDNGYKNFVVEKSQEPSGMTLLIKAAGDQNESIEQLKTKTETILHFLRDKKKPQISSETSEESLQKAIEVFQNFAKLLKEKDEALLETFTALESMKEGFLNSKKVKKETEKINERIKKHQGLIEKMNNMSPHDTALTYYESLRRIGTGKHDFVHARDKKINDKYVREKLASKDSKGVAGYRRLVEDKLKEDAKETTELIKKIQAYDPTDGHKSFYDYYKTIAPKSKLLDHLGYADSGEGSKKRLLDFLQSKKKDAVQHNNDHLEEIEKYIKQQKLNKKLKSKSFANWYFQEKGWGKALMEKAPDYLAPKLLIGFMRRKLSTVEVDGSNPLERINNLEKMLNEYNAVKALENKAKEENKPADVETNSKKAKAICERARNYFFAVPGREAEFQKYFYRTATKEDILQYEQSHIKYTTNGQAESRKKKIEKLRDLLKESSVGVGLENEKDVTKLSQIKKALDELGLKNGDTYDITRIGFWKDRSKIDEHWLGGAANEAMNYIRDFGNILSMGSQSRYGKRRELIKTSISISCIEEYEEKRAKSDDIKVAERHMKILNMVKVRIWQIKNAKDDKDRALLADRFREDYFAGIIDKDAGVKDSKHDDLIDDIRDGKVTDYNVILAFLEKDQDSYMNNHGQRKKDIEKLYKNHEGMDDTEAYYRYNDMRDYSKVRRVWKNATGLMQGGFEKYMREEQEKKLAKLQKTDVHATFRDTADIDQMLRYEKRILSRESRMEKAGYIGTQYVDKATDKIPIVGAFTDKLSYDEEKGKDAWILYEQGVYGLYEKMQRWDKELKDMSDKEKAEEFSKRLRDNMLTGAFSTKWFFSTFFEEIAPQVAIDYEMRRVGEKSAAIDKKIKLAEEFEDRLSFEDRERYLADSKNDHLFYRMTTLKKNYMTDYDEFRKNEAIKNNYKDITPEMAINYQQKRLREKSEDAARLKYIIDHVDETIDPGEEGAEDKKLQLFIEAGGMKLYSEVFKNNIAMNLTREVRKEEYSGKQAIIDYEQERVKHYQELLETLNKPAAEMDEAKNQLEDNIKWVKEKEIIFESLSAKDIFSEQESEKLKAVDEMIQKSKVDESAVGDMSKADLDELLDELKKME